MVGGVVRSMGVDRRRRHGDDVRRRAVALIGAGVSVRQLARRLAVPRGTAGKWIVLYRSGGRSAVMGAGGRRSYDWQTKVAAVRDVVDRGVGKAEAMARHHIASIAPLERWCREYRAGGAPRRCGPGPRAGPGVHPTGRRRLPRASRSWPSSSRSWRRRSPTWKNCMPCRCRGHEARQGRARETACRARAPAGASAGRVGACPVDVLPAALASGARDPARPRAVGQEGVGAHSQRVRAPEGAHVPGA